MSRELDSNSAYFEKVAKLIPTEVIAAYMTIDLMVQDSRMYGYIMVSATIILLITTPLYLWKARQVRNPMQLGVSMASFLVWSYGMGGPFADSDLFSMAVPLMGDRYESVVAGVVIVIWVYLLPILPYGQPIRPKNGAPTGSPA